MRYSASESTALKDFAFPKSEPSKIKPRTSRSLAVCLDSGALQSPISNYPHPHWRSWLSLVTFSLEWNNNNKIISRTTTTKGCNHVSFLFIYVFKYVFSHAIRKDLFFVRLALALVFGAWKSRLHWQEAIELALVSPTFVDALIPAFDCSFEPIHPGSRLAINRIRALATGGFKPRELDDELINFFS